MDIADQRIKRLSRNCVILSGSELSGKTVTEKSLPGDFSEDSNAQSHPGKLESVPNDIKVSSHEDQRHDGSIRDSGSSCKCLSARKVI